MLRVPENCAVVKSLLHVSNFLSQKTTLGGINSNDDLHSKRLLLGDNNLSHEPQWVLIGAGIKIETKKVS
jgi:hypothetical protein